MVTYYVLYDPLSGTFVRSGRYDLRTYSLNNAKHFTSGWNAKNHAARIADGDLLTVKKIQRY